MSPVRRSIRKRRHWYAWSGELADLARLGKLIEELHSARLRELESDDPKQLELTKLFEQVQVMGTLNVTYATLDDEEPYPFIGLVATDDDEVAGPVSEVLPEVDRRSVKSLRFVAALGPSERLSVALVRNRSASVVLDVVSQRPGWAKQALARLADEIEKGVPRWARLRSEGWKVSVAFLVALVVGGFVALVLPKSIEVWRLIIGFIVFMVSWPLQEIVHKWLFPGFELLGEGVQSSGTRRVVTLSLLVASIPIGVLVNSIS